MEKKRKKSCMSISISCPIDLLYLIDDTVAKMNFSSRSDFVIATLKEKLQKVK